MLTEVRLTVFNHLFSAIADEMGVVMERTSFSPNIKERLDFSCALFSAKGEMVAQAAHIPVHLGAMPLSVKAATTRFPHVAPGDVIILNDPYSGGSHLPDITLVQPIFVEENELIAFAACRAHHNDIGGVAPGSMPLSTDVFQEGLRIPPVKLIENGKVNEAVLDLILANVRVPRERQADLAAQIAAVQRADVRIAELIATYGVQDVVENMDALLNYGERLAKDAIGRIPPGEYRFRDVMDGDGIDHDHIPIVLTLTTDGTQATFNFSGTAAQVPGPINCVEAVTLSAVVYAFRCLLGDDAPMNGGLFRALNVKAPEGSLVNAKFPAAVAAGNVETSQRIVDVVLGALAHALPGEIPAASCGSMNNLSIGGYAEDGQPFAYYETMGGGMGAHRDGDGLSAVQVHMTNTKNTPVEALELAYPMRVHRYAIRRGSGGEGRFSGGDGIVRKLEVLQPCDATLLTERRMTAPYGLHGGGSGSPGKNRLWRDGTWHELSAKQQLALKPGDQLEIETPGGGGYGERDV